MLSIVYSTALQGLEGYIVRVETDITGGLPGFELVGLGDTAIKEARDRVKSALKNSDLDFPIKRILINLAPGNLRKEGSIYDLAIATGILSATGQIPLEICQEFSLLGELSLNGEVRSVSGVLPHVISAKEKGFLKVIVPLENAKEASLVKGINIYPVSSVLELVNFLKNPNTIIPYSSDFLSQKENDFQEETDFSEIKGQFAARRAMEIAAAGGHNILMVGSPGSGKTLLARSMPGIMPKMTFEESLETAKIYSLAGLFKDRQENIFKRPFRSPHHTSSAVSLVGGGKYPRPGEISLAHNGILFMDELLEFKRDSLESLRQPLEDGMVTISRVNASIRYPSRWMLVGASNPCPCGFYGDKNKECQCTPSQIKRYMSRLSKPLLDRIDMVIYVPQVSYDELTEIKKAESSASIQKRVQKAREIQLTRFSKSNVGCNAILKGANLRKHCPLSPEASSLLEAVFKKFNFSARSHDKILKVARTIADLDYSPNIEIHHLSEAIQYRGEDKMGN